MSFKGRNVSNFICGGGRKPIPEMVKNLTDLINPQPAAKFAGFQIKT